MYLHAFLNYARLSLGRLCQRESLLFLVLYTYVFRLSLSSRDPDDQTIPSGHCRSTIWKQETEEYKRKKDGNSPTILHFLKKMICFPSEKETAHWDSQWTRWGISGICFILFMFSLKKKNKSIENTRKRGKIPMSSVKVKFLCILILVGGNATRVTLYQH